MYLVLWFWLFGLTILTILHLLLRLVVILLPPVRWVAVLDQLNPKINLFRCFLLLLRNRCFTHSDLSTCRIVLAHCYLGDWFVLYQLSKNSNTNFFRYLLKHLEKSFVSKVGTC